MMRLPGSTQRGFTLLEVLAALAIAAVGLAAVSQTLSSSLKVSLATESRTVAYWVASNHLAEMRIASTVPAAGTSRQQANMAGRRWSIVREVRDTPDPDVLRIEVRVMDPESESDILARLGGYLVRFEPVAGADNADG
jgi:general secretion pathway protein I